MLYKFYIKQNQILLNPRFIMNKTYKLQILQF